MSTFQNSWIHFKWICRSLAINNTRGHLNYFSEKKKKNKSNSNRARETNWAGPRRSRASARGEIRILTVGSTRQRDDLTRNGTQNTSRWIRLNRTLDTRRLPPSTVRGRTNPRATERVWGGAYLAPASCGEGANKCGASPRSSGTNGGQ